MKFFTTLNSPIGPLTLVASEEALIGLYMNEHRHGPTNHDGWELRPNHPVLEETSAQLTQFFGGTRTQFSLPLVSPGTEFQTRCWTELTKIPYGETLSYGEMARHIGQPAASRAVGAANGQNPISIIVPCHRVIGANGKLVGFGGGLPRKAALLGFERAVVFGESAEAYWREAGSWLGRA